METQDARYSRGNPWPNWGEGENETARRRRMYPKVRPYTVSVYQDIANGWYQGETARRRRMYPKVRPYTVSVYQDIANGWYQGEDMMDSNDVAPPAHRVGLPNVDGSIGGDNGYALPPPWPAQQNFYYDRELRRRVTYDRAAKYAKVNTLTLLRRNMPRTPRGKTLPSKVMTIGKRS